ncbi:MAG: O-antigen ligase family protein [Bacteroidales bacterium]|nr:O-antigen ligase family protein [Bacteroidales bacterium]
MIKTIKINQNQYYYWLLILLSLFIPLIKTISSLLIILISVLWLLTGAFTNKFKILYQNKIFLFFIAYYLIYLAGITYSSNIRFALFDLEIKLALLFFPLILGSLYINFFKKLDYEKIENSYIISCIAGSLFCLIRAFIRYFKEDNSLVFYYKEFSYLFHPSYYAMFLILAIIFLIYKTMNNPIGNKSWIINSLMILYFILIIVLLSSKSGIFSFLLIFIFFIFYYTVKIRKIKRSILILFVALSLFFCLYKIFPYSFGRIEIAKKTLEMTKISANTSDGTSERILIWKTSLEIIRENFLFGVGTGDIKDELMRKYKEKKMTTAYNLKLNAHNQYLQSFIATGFLGFIIFLSSLILPAIIAIRQKNIIYLMFIFLVAFNFLFESMLEVQAGVVFYAFFNSLLFLKK